MMSAPADTERGGSARPDYRQRLRSILSQEDDEPARRIRRVLGLGADWFGVERGLLVQVPPSGDTCTVDAASASAPDLTRGLTGDLLSTYCRMVATEGEPLALTNAPGQAWPGEPAYASSLLATYIGTQVHAHGDSYGVVCFADLAPREAPFGENDRTFLELLAQGVGRILEQQTTQDAHSSPSQSLSGGAQHYQTALKHSPVLFAKVDADLRYEWIYNPHEDFSSDAVVGRRDDELDSGPGIDQLMDLKRRAIETGTQIREEITFDRSDGLNAYDVTATPLREGPGDAVTGVVTASLNITEQKQTERKHRESEARYRALAKNFPNGAVGVYDRDLRYTLVEGTLLGETLPAAEALEGSRVPEALPEKTARDLVPLFRAAIAEGATDHMETEYAGRTWCVWATPLRDSAGTIYAGLSFAQDITERKERAATLRRQRNLLEQTQQLAGSWELDLRTDALSWSDETYRIHGLPPDTDLDLETAFSFFPPAARSEVREALRTCCEERASYDLELPLVTAEGNQRWVRAVGGPVNIEDGEVRKVAGAFQDITERKEAERELRDREARLRGLTNSIPGVVYQVVADSPESFRYDFVSEHTASLLGISADPDGFHERFLQHVPPSHRDRARQAIANTIRNASSLRLQVPFDPPEGDRIWLFCLSTPEQRGDTLLLDGVMLDITDQKRAERRLREERDRFATLFHNLPTPVVRGRPDADGHLRAQSVNAAFESVFGHAAEAAEGADLQSLIVPPDQQGSADSIRRRLLAGKAVDREVERMTADGRRNFRVQVALREGDPMPEEGYAIYTDITERKRRERILRERREKVKALYEAADQLLRATDAAEIAASILTLITDVFGYRVGVHLVRDEQLIPLESSPDLPPQSALCTPISLDANAGPARAVREQDTLEFENLPAPDDPFAPERFRAATIVPIGEHGTISVGATTPGTIDGFDRRLIKVLATYASAVLDRLDREEALIEAKEAAEEAARLKSSMMANMSHEIRTPLTSIIGFAELLADELEGLLGTFAEKAHQSSNRLLKTLNSVLELSRLEAGAFNLERERVCLRPIAKKTVERLRPEAARADVQVRTQLPDGPVEGPLHEEAVRRILENLLENAIKFTPAQGTVTVCVRTDAGDAVLDVEDTGIGISDDALPDIFETFKQESEGLDREYEGSGLGLSIVQELTDALDGTLELETEKGVGSRFTVRLPRPHDSPA